MTHRLLLALLSYMLLTGTIRATDRAPKNSTALVPQVKVSPVYPPQAAPDHLHGEVQVYVKVSETGDVVEAKFASGDATFSEAAVTAARQWKFAPFIKGGKAVSLTSLVPFAFNEQPSSEPDPPGKASSTSSPVITCLYLDDREKPHQRCAGGKLVNKMYARYPDEAKRRGIQGTVVLRMLLDVQGQVARVIPLSGLNPLVDSSIDAVKQWRYSPFTFEGQPAKAEMEVHVNFTMR